MCTYATTRIEINASAKGREGWFAATGASVYFDHPVHFPAGHALNIDVLSPVEGPGARVALEMDASSARALAHAILDTLDGVPEGLDATIPH